MSQFYADQHRAGRRMCWKYSGVQDHMAEMQLSPAADRLAHLCRDTALSEGRSVITSALKEHICALRDLKTIGKGQNLQVLSGANADRKAMHLTAL